MLRQTGEEILAGLAGRIVPMATRRRHRTPVLEIEARAETPTSSREDRDFAVVVGGDAIERVVQFAHEIEADRVQAFRPVEPDRSDVVGDGFERDGWHASSRRCSGKPANLAMT
jgi:hypothetical protein